MKSSTAGEDVTDRNVQLRLRPSDERTGGDARHLEPLDRFGKDGNSQPGSDQAKDHLLVNGLLHNGGR